MFIQQAFADNGAAVAAQPSIMGQFLLFLPFIAIFYFFVIRPQSKRAKEHRAMIDALSVGNEVMFAGGLLGKITKLEGDYAIISLNKSNEIKIQRGSIISVLPVGTLDKI